MCAIDGREFRNGRSVAKQASRQLEEALEDLTTALCSTGAQWMVIGGIAVIARGVRRFTSDIDAAIRGDQVSVSAAIKALAKRRIVPRIPNAEAFARDNLVLLLRHASSDVEFDVSFAWTQFEHEAIGAATTARFGATKAPMAQAEDLVVFKAIAGRGKDHDDAVALLTLYPDANLMRIRSRVKALAELADAPQLVGGLEVAIAESMKRKHTAGSRGARPALPPTESATGKPGAIANSRVRKTRVGRKKARVKARRNPKRARPGRKRVGQLK